MRWILRRTSWEAYMPMVSRSHQLFSSVQCCQSLVAETWSRKLSLEPESPPSLPSRLVSLLRRTCESKFVEKIFRKKMFSWPLMQVPSSHSVTYKGAGTADRESYPLCWGLHFNSGPLMHWRKEPRWVGNVGMGVFVTIFIFYMDHGRRGHPKAWKRCSLCFGHAGARLWHDQAQDS